MNNDKKIILADSYPETEDVFKEFFQKYMQGYSLYSCNNEESFYKIMELKNNISAVVIHHMLGKILQKNYSKINGKRIVEKYAGTDLFKNVPFILFHSGGTDEDIFKKDMLKGAYVYIEPLNWNDFFDKLKKCIE